MSEQPSHQRQTAARAFMQALGQLETVLQPGEETAPAAPEKRPEPKPTEPSPAPVQPLSAAQSAAQDWEAALAEAAADIEQFMNTHDSSV